MLNAQHGKIKYIDKVMAVYRIHDTSYWSSKKDEDQQAIIINFLNTLKTFFNDDIQKIIDRQIQKIKSKNLPFFEKKLFKLKSFFNR